MCRQESLISPSLHMTQLKIAIIGGNIIGSYLARKIKERGHQATIFEKNNFLGQKPCSGLISERIFNFSPALKDFIIRRIDFLIVHFKKKDIKINFNPPQYLFERSQLDNFFLKMAESAGVEARFGREIKNIPEGFDRIIGCDGSFSTIRKLLKINAPRQRVGIQYFIKEKNKDLTIEVWPRNFEKDLGFLWRIPFLDKTEYGIIGRPKDASVVLKDFLQKKGIVFERANVKSALIAQGIVLPQKKEITLCGDAAGLTSPLSGGGIIWGLTAANMMIEKFPDFLEYRKSAYRFFKPKEKRASILRNGSLLLNNFFGLGAMSALLPREVVIDPNLFVPFWRYEIKY